MALAAAVSSKVIDKFQRKKGDTGSSEVQIALLTQRIKNLAPHFEKNVKDTHSQRGLQSMVSQRRRLLGYLKRTNPQAYAKLVKDLELRG